MSVCRAGPQSCALERVDAANAASARARPARTLDSPQTHPKPTLTHSLTHPKSTHPPPHPPTTPPPPPPGKYLVNDVLAAKCEAPIRVEVVDRSTGLPLGEDLPGVSLELAVLDGSAYEARAAEGAGGGGERVEDLDSCALLLNNKASALLVPGAGGALTAEGRVAVALGRGAATLPELHVTDSSEALLSGRKPPFRLLARAVGPGGAPAPVRHAVSEGFVVATRRTRTAGKVRFGWLVLFAVVRLVLFTFPCLYRSPPPRALLSPRARA